MDQGTGQYLAAVRRQVATTLRPFGLGDLAQKHSVYVERVLNYLTVESRDLPIFAVDYVAELRLLLPSIRMGLAEQPSCRAEFEAALADPVDLKTLGRAMQQAVALLIGQAAPASRQLLQHLGAIEARLQQQFQDAIRRENVITIAEPPGETGFSDEQRGRLLDFLRAKFPREKAVSIAEVRAIPGGFSKVTIFVKLANTCDLPEDIVLRIDKPNSPVDSTVVNEFEIISALFAAGVPVPKPLISEADRSILGSPFILVERLKGSMAGDAFDALAPTREIGTALARGMARMHKVPVASLSAAVPGARTSVSERILGDVRRFEEQWRATGQQSVALEMAYGWLNANTGFASGGRRSIVHSDLGAHNLLVDDGQLTAILDWETVVIGNPAQDLGYVWCTAIQMMPWEDFLKEYEASGGTRPTTQQFNYYRIWRHVWLMTMIFQAKVVIDGGDTSDIGLVYNVLNLQQRLTATLQNLLCEIEQEGYPAAAWA